MQAFFFCPNPRYLSCKPCWASTCKDDKTYNGTDNFLKLKEQMLYGSDRVGVLSRDILVATTSADPLGDDRLYRNLKHKNYELKNHLGNILTTVDGRRIANNSGGT